MSSFTIVRQVAIGYIGAVEGAVVIELYDARSCSPYPTDTILL